MPTDEPRPIEVPLDWINVDCQNPSCIYTVWVPPEWLTAPPQKGTTRLSVCSSECAMAVMRPLG